MAVKETDSECAVCGGVILEEKTIRFRDEAPIGPASKDFAVEKTEYHCRYCGIVYKFPPQFPK